jgi:hypothetical protein
MSTPYILRTDKQQAGSTDLERTIQELIDNFVLTDSDLKEVKQILDDNNISYED